MTATDLITHSSRTVLVTGSTSGIGAATARTLADQGWSVIVTDRDANRGAVVVTDIQRGGGRATFVASDLARPPDSLRVFARAAGNAAGGQLDAVVHNAALCPPVDTVSLTDDDLEATLAVNIATRTPVNAGDGDVVFQMTTGTPAGGPGTFEEIAWVLSDQAEFLHGTAPRSRLTEESPASGADSALHDGNPPHSRYPRTVRATPASPGPVALTDCRASATPQVCVSSARL